MKNFGLTKERYEQMMIACENDKEWVKEMECNSTDTCKQSKKWAVLSDWAIRFEVGESCIVGVYSSEDKAKEALKKQVTMDDKTFAEDYNLEIFEDSDTQFDAGIVGEYIGNHVCTRIVEVSEN